MFQHDTESRQLLARERAELLASEMRAGAAASLRGLMRPFRGRRSVESRQAPEAAGLSAGVRPI